MDHDHPPTALDGVEAAQRVRELECQLHALSHAIGHELRAPLRIAAGYLGMFSEDHGGTLTDAAHGMLAVACQQIASIDAMLLALLDLSEVSSAALRHEPLNISLLAGEAAALANDAAATPVHIAPLENVGGDRRLLALAWRHLLHNAVKFTAQPGQNTIHVSSQSHLGECWYCVRDTGLGFDMRDAARLFEPLVRSPDRRFGGAGMGLAIVRRIVERHHGRVWAESEPSVGSAFYFALPIAAKALE